MRSQADPRQIVLTIAVLVPAQICRKPFAFGRNLPLAASAS
jgi:hypothetical protein